MNIILSKKFTPEFMKSLDKSMVQKIMQVFENIKICNSVSDVIKRLKANKIKEASNNIYSIRLNIKYRLIFSSFENNIAVLDIIKK